MYIELLPDDYFKYHCQKLTLDGELQEEWLKSFRKVVDVLFMCCENFWALGMNFVWKYSMRLSQNQEAMSRSVSSQPCRKQSQTSDLYRMLLANFVNLIGVCYIFCTQLMNYSDCILSFFWNLKNNRMFIRKLCPSAFLVFDLQFLKGKREFRMTPRE